MNEKRMKRMRLLGCVLAVIMVVNLMLSLTVSIGAVSVNQAVTDAKNGVVQIQIWFNDFETDTAEYLQFGTGFLVNETTVVTCQHGVTAFSDDSYVRWAQAVNAATGQNRTVAEVKECLELRVMVRRDVYVTAAVRTHSTAMDYAVLSLSQPISNRTILALRDSSTLEQTEEVFALGFPGSTNDLTDMHRYDVRDVTITSGNVNKVADLSFSTVEGTAHENVNCVESSALITGGNSGGPLVDANGAVVGINAVETSTSNLAVSSKLLIDVLDALNIPYTKVAAPVVEPVTKPTQTDDKNTEEDKDEKEDKEDQEADGLDATVFVIIGVGAVVLIPIIVLISKKKAPDTSHTMK